MDAQVEAFYPKMKMVASDTVNAEAAEIPKILYHTQLCHPTKLVWAVSDSLLCWHKILSDGILYVEQSV